jgi:hypothetical protein
VVDECGIGVARVSEDLLGLPAQRCAKLRLLMSVMYAFNGLLEAYGNDQADDDGRDVNEEVLPAADRIVRSMYIEHLSVAQPEAYCSPSSIFADGARSGKNAALHP